MAAEEPSNPPAEDFGWFDKNDPAAGDGSTDATDPYLDERLRRMADEGDVGISLFRRLDDDEDGDEDVGYEPVTAVPATIVPVTAVPAPAVAAGPGDEGPGGRRRVAVWASVAVLTLVLFGLSGYAAMRAGDWDGTWVNSGGGAPGSEASDSPSPAAADQGRRSPSSSGSASASATPSSTTPGTTPTGGGPGPTTKPPPTWNSPWPTPSPTPTTKDPGGPKPTKTKPH